MREPRLFTHHSNTFYLESDVKEIYKEYDRLCESFTNILEKEQMLIVKKDIETFNELKKLL